MAAVDDATGEVLAAFFTPVESSAAYLRLLHTVIVTHGLPAAIYQDRHSALHRNDRLCSLAYTATVGHDHAVRLGGLILDLPPGPRGRSYAQARVEVRQLLDGAWRVSYQDGLIATAPPTGPADELRTLTRRRPASPSAPPLSVFNGGHFHVAVKGTD